MEVELIHRPGNTAAKVSLNVGETITAEAGAMIAMSGNMDITTTTHKKKQKGRRFLGHSCCQQGNEAYFQHTLWSLIFCMAIGNNQAYTQVVRCTSMALPHLHEAI